MSSEVCIVIHYAMTLCIYQILVATPRRRGQTVASRLSVTAQQSLRDCESVYTPSPRLSFATDGAKLKGPLVPCG